jgi:zinc transport system permease protein
MITAMISTAIRWVSGMSREIIRCVITTMPDFLLHALIVGTLIAIMAGPLGCMVVWRRMAYFGAAIAHSGLLGVALSLLTGGYLLGMNTGEGSLLQRTGRSLVEDPWPVVLLVSLLLAIGLLAMQRRHLLASDTLLGIVAHGSLAVGLLIVAAMVTLRIDVMSYLFGDILSIDHNDLILMSLLAIVVLMLTVYYWRPLLSSTVNPDLALIEGVNVRQTELIFVLMLACVVALGMRVVGILLIISMLIIPPATVRKLVTTPSQMAIGASIVGVLDVWIGLVFSWYADLPAGPSIVAVSMVFFVLAMLLPKR